MKKTLITQLGSLVLTFTLFLSCNKDSEQPSEAESIFSKVIFYQTPQDNLDEASVFCKMEMAETQEAITVSGKFNQDGRFEKISSILHKSPDESHTFGVFFSDAGDEMLAFKILQNLQKDSLVLRIVKFEETDSIHYQMYFYKYDWNTNIGELLYTLGYDESGVNFRDDLDDAIDDAIDTFKKGKTHLIWGTFTKLYELIDEAIDNAKELPDDIKNKTKELWTDAKELFRKDGPVNTIEEEGEDAFNKKAKRATPEETSAENNTVVNQLNFGNNSTLPPNFGEIPEYKIQAIPPYELAGVPNSTFPKPIKVKVTDLNGNGVDGIKVRFRTGNGDGILNPTIAVTNAEGIAQTSWTLGTDASQIATFTMVDINPLLVRPIGVQAFEAKVDFVNPLIGTWLMTSFSDFDCAHPNNNFSASNASGVLCGWDHNPNSCLTRYFIFTSQSFEDKEIWTQPGMPTETISETLAYTFTDATFKVCEPDDPADCDSYVYTISGNTLNISISDDCIQYLVQFVRQ